ncbi:unnamed protein product [Symbiodinium microadriaticum]|nr:unnamed protein product [Symbiodinium microadriaticum]
MATPQRVFAENIHFWVLPLILVLLKILFDVMPKPIFIGLFGACVLALYAYDKYKVKQIEKEASEMEKSADIFLNELEESERIRKAAEAKEKALKAKQKEDRQKTAASKRSKIDTQESDTVVENEPDDDDDDEDSMLGRMAQIQSKKKK